MITNASLAHRFGVALVALATGAGCSYDLPPATVPTSVYFLASPLAMSGTTRIEDIRARWIKPACADPAYGWVWPSCDGGGAPAPITACSALAGEHKAPQPVGFNVDVSFRRFEIGLLQLPPADAFDREQRAYGEIDVARIVDGRDYVLGAFERLLVTYKRGAPGLSDTISVSPTTPGGVPDCDAALDSIQVGGVEERCRRHLPSTCQ